MSGPISKEAARMDNDPVFSDREYTGREITNIVIKRGVAKTAPWRKISPVIWRHWQMLHSWSLPELDVVLCSRADDQCLSHNRI